MNSAAKLTEDLLEAARLSGVPIVQTMVHASEPPTFPQVFLDGDEFVTLFDAVRPVVLYLVAMPLGINDLRLEARTELRLADDAPLPEEVEASLHQLEKYKSETCRVTAQFVIGGVLHWAISSAPWLDSYDEAVELAEERSRQMRLHTHELDRSDHAAKVDSLARQLATEPAFTHGRTSAAKRLFLAENMFPGEDPHLLREAVERAEQFVWLAQSGFEPPLS